MEVSTTITPDETFFTQRPSLEPVVKDFKLRNGMKVTIRTICPEDEPLMVQFHQTLSDRSIYFRYFHIIGLRQRIDHERLSHTCRFNPKTEWVLVAEYFNPQPGRNEIIAVARLNKIQHTQNAEFAVLISDMFQGLGLGSGLLKELIQFARDQGILTIFGDIHPENGAMQKVCRKLGFQLKFSLEDQFFTATLDL